MKIRDIMRQKGATTVCVSPNDTVTSLLSTLARHGIGAVVVSTTGSDIAGIISERDIVRNLASAGTSILDGTISTIMTSDVVTCTPEQTTDELADLMTTRRIRHVPVVQDGELVGVISIGDVVKQRMAELASERDQLTAYITN